MKRLSRMFNICALALMLTGTVNGLAIAREKIYLSVTGEDLSGETLQFNQSQNEYELVVSREEFITWRRAANKFRYNNDLSSKGESDQPQDLFFVDNNWLPFLIQNSWVSGLSGLAADKSRFVPGLLDVATKDGILYAVPFSTKGLVLYYRSDFHTAYGLKTPECLDDLVSNCRVLMEKERLDHGLTIHYSAIHLDVLPFIWSQGGDILNNGKAALSSPKVLETMTLLSGLSKQGILPGKKTFDLLKKDYRNALTLFMEGKSAYLISWSSRVSDLEQSPLKGRFGVMQVPPFKRGQASFSVIGSWYFAIHAGSLHQKGARAFLDFMCSDRMQTIMASTHPGFLPVIQEDWKAGAPAMQNELKRALGSMRHRLNHPREQDISQVFENAVKQIVVEGRPALDILPAADHRIDSLLTNQ